MKGLLFAGAVGYLVGTLFAPRKGKDLRADVAKHFGKLQEEGSELVQSGVREGQQLVSDVAQKGSELKELGSKRLANATAAASKAGDIAAESIERLGSDLGAVVDKSKDILNNNHHE